MNRKIKTKEEASKTSPTEPTLSKSTKTFVKRIVDDNPWWWRLEKPYSTKYSMSSKDWEEAFRDLDQMIAVKKENLPPKTP